MDKRRSMDGGTQEYPLPIPVQMFLWRHIRSVNYIELFLLFFKKIVTCPYLSLSKRLIHFIIFQAIYSS